MNNTSTSPGPHQLSVVAFQVLQCLFTEVIKGFCQLLKLDSLCSILKKYIVCLLCFLPNWIQFTVKKATSDIRPELYNFYSLYFDTFIFATISLQTSFGFQGLKDSSAFSEYFARGVWRYYYYCF